MCFYSMHIIVKRKTNVYEAKLIVSIICEYEKIGLLNEYTIGVICFWKAQCNLIQKC